MSNQIKIAGHKIYPGRSWSLRIVTDGGLLPTDEFRCQLHENKDKDPVFVEPSISLEDDNLTFELTAQQTATINSVIVEGDVWLVRGGVELNEPLISRIEIKVGSSFTEPSL